MHTVLFLEEPQVRTSMTTCRDKIADILSDWECWNEDITHIGPAIMSCQPDLIIIDGTRVAANNAGSYLTLIELAQTLRPHVPILVVSQNNALLPFALAARFVVVHVEDTLHDERFVKHMVTARDLVTHMDRPSQHTQPLERE